MRYSGLTKDADTVKYRKVNLKRGIKGRKYEELDGVRQRTVDWYVADRKVHFRKMYL